MSRSSRCSPGRPTRSSPGTRISSPASTTTRCGRRAGGATSACSQGRACRSAGSMRRPRSTATSVCAGSPGCSIPSGSRKTSASIARDFIKLFYQADVDERQLDRSARRGRHAGRARGRDGMRRCAWSSRLLLGTGGGAVARAGDRAVSPRARRSSRARSRRIVRLLRGRADAGRNRVACACGCRASPPPRWSAPRSPAPAPPIRRCSAIRWSRPTSSASRPAPGSARCSASCCRSRSLGIQGLAFAARARHGGAGLSDRRRAARP